jgi:tRNA threonylcarbamoyladenosine biosynthesis protein TsaB
VSELILSIDTTQQFGSLALLDGEKVMEEVLLHSPEGFSHILYPELHKLLDRRAVRVADIQCFAATSGPGLFTGVRIGLACVKGLAEATGRPVAPVSNLKALAASGTQPLRAAIMDARRGEIYGGLYDADLNAVMPEIVAPLETWLRSLPEGALEFISSDFSTLAAALQGKHITMAPRALATPAGKIALRMLRLGETLDPAEVDANYVRRSDAELFWKE